MKILVKFLKILVFILLIVFLLSFLNFCSKNSDLLSKFLGANSDGNSNSGSSVSFVAPGGSSSYFDGISSGESGSDESSPGDPEIPEISDFIQFNVSTITELDLAQIGSRQKLASLILDNESYNLYLRHYKDNYLSFGICNSNSNIDENDGYNESYEIQYKYFDDNYYRITYCDLDEFCFCYDEINLETAFNPFSSFFSLIRDNNLEDSNCSFDFDLSESTLTESKLYPNEYEINNCCSYFDSFKGVRLYNSFRVDKNFDINQYRNNTFFQATQFKNKLHFKVLYDGTTNINFDYLYSFYNGLEANDLYFNTYYDGQLIKQVNNGFNSITSINKDYNLTNLELVQLEFKLFEPILSDVTEGDYEII